ncbi:hypothetical protein BGZ95_006002 [Linnemannia exigua]|uniref:Uncharacterized protein n=1 Tax=Linnemannia exigua TaxID=604196 RepID=A0AAD4DGB0_9FUNG|nr:hypothetical protein BGZ95_006002 [Linnemannia exigua]
MTIRTNNQQHHTITNGNNTTQQQQPAAASPNLIPAASVSAAASRHSSLGLGAGIPDSSHGHGHGLHGGQRVPQESSNSSTLPTVQATGATADETAEQVLLSSFKAAALSVTQLYKDSLKFQRAEHAKGYEAALQDLLAFISNHPVVQEKKDLGMTEDEIRQTTSLSIDDVVRFISNARAMNCNSAAVAGVGNDMHLHQQQQHQQEQQQHLQAQQAQQQAHEQQQQQQQLHQQQLLQQQQLQQQEQQHQHEQQQQQQFIQQQQQQQQQSMEQQHLQQQQLHHQQQQQQQLQQQQHQQQQPLSNGGGGGGGGPQLSSSIAAATPSSIFPSDAFTFTPPIFHPGLGATGTTGAFQSIFPGQEGGIGQQMAVDSLKRRYALQDFNVAASRMMAGANHNNNTINNINSPANSNINMIGNNGRMMGGGNQPLNLNLNVNMDSFGAFHDQPPFKRGRRREGE